jgi:hypothetical protein
MYETHCGRSPMVFDADGRTQRQLEELRRLTSILWDSVSDVIVISAATRRHTLFLPNHGGGGSRHPWVNHRVPC